MDLKQKKIVEMLIKFGIKFEIAYLFSQTVASWSLQSRGTDSSSSNDGAPKSSNCISTATITRVIASKSRQVTVA